MRSKNLGMRHVCPMPSAAAGLIDASWCFERMAPVLSALTPIESEADMLRPKLLVAEDGRLTVRYCPTG
jgi:hypothetical protein